MVWWGWCVVGAILLGSELGFVDAQFYLVFVGGSAIVVGLLAGLMPSMAHWAQWALFALIALVSVVTLRKQLYERVRRYPPIAAGPKDQLLTLPADLDPGQSCQVEHGGTFWTVQNDGDSRLTAGSRVRVAQIRGLTLLVHAASQT
jgi:membrane protein implicated in regulation of membrane protease activity